MDEFTFIHINTQDSGDKHSVATLQPSCETLYRCTRSMVTTESLYSTTAQLRKMLEVYTIGVVTRMVTTLQPSYDALWDSSKIEKRRCESATAQLRSTLEQF